MEHYSGNVVAVNSNLRIAVSSFELEHGRICSDIPLADGSVALHSGGYKSTVLTLYGNVYSPAGLVVILDGLVHSGNASSFAFEGLMFSGMILKQYKCRRNDRGVYSCELVLIGNSEVTAGE